MQTSALLLQTIIKFFKIYSVSTRTGWGGDGN